VGYGWEPNDCWTGGWGADDGGSTAVAGFTTAGALVLFLLAPFFGHLKFARSLSQRWAKSPGSSFTVACPQVCHCSHKQNCNWQPCLTYHPESPSAQVFRREWDVFGLVIKPACIGCVLGDITHEVCSEVSRCFTGTFFLFRFPLLLRFLPLFGRFGLGFLLTVTLQLC